MAVANSKEEKSRRKYNRGRSKVGPRTGVRTSGRTALLTKPNLHKAGPGRKKKKKKKKYKKRSPS